MNKGLKKPYLPILSTEPLSSVVFVFRSCCKEHLNIWFFSEDGLPLSFLTTTREGFSFWLSFSSPVLPAQPVRSILSGLGERPSVPGYEPVLALGGLCGCQSSDKQLLGL